MPPVVAFLFRSLQLWDMSMVIDSTSFSLHDLHAILRVYHESGNIELTWDISRNEGDQVDMNLPLQVHSLSNFNHHTGWWLFMLFIQRSKEEHWVWKQWIKLRLTCSSFDYTRQLHSHMQICQFWRYLIFSQYLCNHFDLSYRDLKSISWTYSLPYLYSEYI